MSADRRDGHSVMSAVASAVAPTLGLPVAEGNVALDARVASGLAAASGLLYFLGFPGLGLWPCALVAWAPLLVAIEGRPPRQGFALAALAGFTMNVLGFYWLYGAVSRFGGLPGPLAAFVMLLLCGYQAGRAGLLGWLYVRARERGWPAGAAFLLAEVASETVYPLLFPYYAAASVHDVPALMQLAELGGPVLVGCVLAAPSASLAELATGVRNRRPVRWAVVAAGILPPLAAALIGHVRAREVDAMVLASKSVHVGLVQRNLSPRARPVRARRGGLQPDLRMTDALRAKGVELAV